MKKKLIPYGKHKINKDDINAVVNVLKSPFITQGPKVEEFEKKISKKVHSKYSIAVNSATSALHIACLSLGLNKSDNAWTSSTSFVASANCILYCGAKLDFVDINSETGLMDIEKLELKLKNAKKDNCLPKIVIPVHLGGASCDMKRIKKLSIIYNFKIIEDASHAIGGKYKDSFVGSCKYSDISVFSFHPVKIITTGEGGIATTNKKSLALKMSNLRSHGITKDVKRFEGIIVNPWTYEQQTLGYNYRMSEIQAALGISQLKRLDKLVKKRNILLNNYHKLCQNSKIIFQKIPSDVYSSVHLAISFVKNITEEDHKNLFNFLKESNIGVQIHYQPIHLNPYFQKIGFSKGQFIKSEDYANNAITLPLFPELKIEDQKYIIEKYKEGISKLRI